MFKLSLTTAFVAKTMLIGLTLFLISRSDTKAAVIADTAAEKAYLAELQTVGRIFIQPFRHLRLPPVLIASRRSPVHQNRSTGAVALFRRSVYRAGLTEGRLRNPVREGKFRDC